MLKKLIAMQKRIMDTAKAEKRELNEGEQREFNLLQSLIDNIRSEENNGQGNACLLYTSIHHQKYRKS